MHVITTAIEVYVYTYVYVYTIHVHVCIHYTVYTYVSLLTEEPCRFHVDRNEIQRRDWMSKLTYCARMLAREFINFVHLALPAISAGFRQSAIGW